MSNSNWVPPLPGQPPAKKKSNWLLYTLLGCGGLVVIVILVVVIGGMYIWSKVPKTGPELAKAAIEMANPDIEVLKIDENTGTITVKDKKTGKTTTMNMDDAKNGKISFESEGSNESVTIGAGAGENLPDWVVTYPGAAAQGGLTGTKEGRASGTMAYTTSDSLEKVINYYKEQLPSKGFTLDENQMQPTDTFAMLSAKSADEKRTFTVTVTTQDGTTNIQVGFEEKAE